MEDKDLYVKIGEIQKTQEHLTKMVEAIAKRQERMDSRINYAIGVVATIVFFFQAGWTYLTKMGKA